MRRLGKHSKVYVQFPKTGLGNMLLVWARAVVFSELNDAVCVTGAWWGLRWGALIRREHKKRLYVGYFKESRLWDRLRIRLAMATKGTVYDPPVKQLEAATNTNNEIFVFNKVVTDPDLFGALRDHRPTVEAKLYELLQPSLRERLDAYPNPVIGMHIRRGDFILSKQATPLAYFIKALECVRRAAGADLPVTIFTDAAPKELEDLLQLKHVSIAATGADILDILLLSKSRIMILSRDSTFGYWAAFLSRALVILRHDDWQTCIRKTEQEEHEVRLNTEDESSVKALQELIHHFKLTP